ncbi:MAG TPA: discoidin domain-containing protein [Actinocrinis sp.]
MIPFASGSPPRRRSLPGRMPRQVQAVLLTVLAVALACAGVFAANQTAHAATASACGTTDAALNQPTTASSEESGSFPPQDATDGNTATRWSSAWSDPQWLQVDLGSTQSICGVSLDWETAYATAFQIQTSNDASTWTTVYSTTTGTGGTQNLTVSGSGRYIRMYGTTRATGYGYSLWEFDVYTGTGGTSSSPSPSPSSSSPPVNWTPVWSDDFAGSAGTAPSSANWIEDTGTSAPGGPANWGTGEVETMSNSTSNVHLDGNDHLDITALDSNGAWTSGRIETQRSDFAAPAGGMLQISASIEQPDPANGVGYWPAFWTLGAGDRTGGTWPAVGETDIMEDVNGRSETSGTLHCGVAPGGPCNEYTGRTSGMTACPGCQTGYHTYTEIIDRTQTNEQIRWYLDGTEFWSVSESQVGTATWQAAVDHGFFIIFDLAIGGSFPNADCGCTSPNVATSSGGTMSIASVSVQQATTGTTPAAPPTPPAAPPNTPSVVKVTGSQGDWGLSVNGAPYYIKGVTYGPSNADAGYYMPDLASMGVNTVRTWGTDSTTESLLDAADANGIKVINGFWLSQSEDYVNDTTDETNDLNNIVALVDQYKDNGAVLMWDVGNEVINTLSSTYSGTQLQAEQVAYAQYVNRVVDAIHAADPNHPVTSTDAWVGAWPYYQQYTPDLDLMAVNSYGAACGVQSAWQSGGYTKPYILTEAGPPGEWEVPNDENGVPQEDTDQQSTQGYATDWNCVTAAKGVALGATLFNYGVENDFGGIWFNFLTGDWRRDSYYEISSLYGGQYTSDQAPVITGMTVSDPTSVAAGKTFTVDVSATSPIGAPLRYSADLCSKYIDGNTAQQGATFSATSGGVLTITAPDRIGVWKVDVYVYDDQGNAAVQTASINVVPPTPAGTDVALGKTTTASSYQTTGTGAPFTPGDATDGSLTTRWASDWSDPQWIEVDLGQTYPISHIQLVWEAAYGQAYQIQTSNDGQNWTTVYSTTTGVGGVDDFNVSGSGRYVRMYGTARGTSYGYSLYEFGVYTPS